jgi:uncharacterized delta-60 repeat protein
MEVTVDWFRAKRRFATNIPSAVVGAAVAAALLAVTAQAAPGDLDPTFDVDGKVVTDVGGGRASAVAIQPDGKLVAAGSGSGHFAIARYRANGSLDPTFGLGGKVITQVGGIFDAASAVAIQTDGKVVAAGGTAPGGFCCQFALMRLNSDGSLDATFGNGGTVTTPFGGISTASALAIQADGKIVAAGSKFDPFGSGFALARYNSDGSLDSTFDGDGKVVTGFSGASDRAAAVSIQADGKIVAAGAGGPANDFVLARYQPDGSLDPTFGSGGKVSTDFGGFDAANAATLQPDGKIVAAGIGGFFSRFALARYESDGSLDAGFGSGGKVTTSFAGENIESANGVAIQQNDKIVAAGRAFIQFDSSFALARYNADGSLDSTFGSGGKITTDFGNPADVGVLCPPARKDCSEDIAAAVAIQPDGNIVAVGGGGACIPPCLWTLARYLGDPTAIRVAVDIRPESSSNPIKLLSRGVVPVAVLTTDAFDAATILANTVCFGDDDHANERDCTEADGNGHIEDVNGDGRSDLLLHFDVSETGIDPGDTEACLTGMTASGIGIEGCDVVTTL